MGSPFQARLAGFGSRLVPHSGGTAALYAVPRLPTAASFEVPVPDNRRFALAEMFAASSEAQMRIESVEGFRQG
jgi:hypothetical protein